MRSCLPRDRWDAGLHAGTRTPWTPLRLRVAGGLLLWMAWWPAVALAQPASARRIEAIDLSVAASPAQQEALRSAGLERRKALLRERFQARRSGGGGPPAPARAAARTRLAPAAAIPAYVRAPLGPDGLPLR